MASSVRPRTRRASRLGVIAWIGLACLTGFPAHGDVWVDCPAEGAPRFEDYPTPVHAGTIRADLRTDMVFARRYRSLLSRGLRDGPVNFAGRYVMVTWGCGSTCLFGGWVEAETGGATPLPHLLDGFGFFGLDDPLRYRAESRLLVMLGFAEDGTDNPLARYAELRDGELRPICEAEWTEAAAARLGESWQGTSDEWEPDHADP